MELLRIVFRRWAVVAVMLGFLGAGGAKAEMQFDVFLGYDGIVREAAWFPVACEILNDGPTFNGVVEISAANLGADQVRKVSLELPTNTRKRLVIPVFASGGRFFQWNVRLKDEQGKIRAEHLGIQPTTLAWEGVLLGALPGAYAGMPVLPEHPQMRTRQELKPQVARLQVETFPDNPIALEGLDAIYLNSERALNLKVDQIAALLAWLHGGGHLIVAVEQITDVNATPWLQALLPIRLKDVVNVTVDRDIHSWLQRTEVDIGSKVGFALRANQRIAVGPRNPYAELVIDPAFKEVSMPVATGVVEPGARVLLSAEQQPLLIRAPRGRGEITVATFNPEREPFRSWKHRGWFWSRVMQIPSAWYMAGDIAAYGGWSLDGVFGALIDSRQVHKLPVEWLLALLVVYLVVIGPLDQYWLKKIGRQMLTWITFPAYVVIFSLLIYYIGYKLRAGETEWNELHVVDVLPRNEDAELRGRTFISLYSSSNARYPLASEQPYATLRGELLDLYGGGKEASRATIEQTGNNFRAEIFVPVWTSLLYVGNWMQPGAIPFTVTVLPAADGWEVQVENLLDRQLVDARIVIQGTIYDLGTLPPQERKTIVLNPQSGRSLSTFVQQYATGFQQAVEARRSALGSEQAGQLENPAVHSMAASFPSLIPTQPHQRSCVYPPGFDLAPLAERGDTILLAWDPGQSPIQSVNRFKPPRFQGNTLFRLAVPGPTRAMLGAM